MGSEELATVRELLRGVGLDDLTIAGRRAAIESVAAPPPVGTTVEPVGAGGVPAGWVVAAGVDSVRVLLYLHGGAYQIGSPATLRRMIALISAAAQSAPAAGWRLHPFPAAVDDALAACRFLLDGGAGPAAIAIAGDSAGGGLALATLVALRDAGDPLPAAAVAMSPWTDLALTGESMSTRAAESFVAGVKPSGGQAGDAAACRPASGTVVSLRR
jgi:acetyl esterase/lipase